MYKPGSVQGNILSDGLNLGPFPHNRLKGVDTPTNRITDDVKRIDPRENGFRRAACGDYRAKTQLISVKLVQNK